MALNSPELHPLPLCASARVLGTPAQGRPRSDQNRAGQSPAGRPAPRCAITRTAIRTTYGMSEYGTAKYSWAGAATPTQPSASPPQEPPRKDSNVSQATPLLRDRATCMPDPATREGHSQRDTWTAWLTEIPHRVGTRLFLACDEEAYWRGWEITPTCGGLSRSYRDSRFDARLATLWTDAPDGGGGGAR